MHDPYLTPEGLLVNILGIEDPRQLAAAEADFAYARSLTYVATSHPTFDVTHLCRIHRHLFEDVYRWAGEFRTVGIGKGGPDGFWPWDGLGRRADKVFTTLGEGPLLRTVVSDGEFETGIATLYLDVNQLHPFREGNGRTQRMFLSDVARVSGRTIDWLQVTRESNDSACAESLATQSPRALRKLLAPVIEDAEQQL